MDRFDIIASLHGALTAGFVALSMCLPTDQQQRQPNEQQTTTHESLYTAMAFVNQPATQVEEQGTNHQTSSWCDWLWSSGPADWALIIVAVGTMFAALRTLKTIEQQVTANENAADAARDNAKAAADNAAAARTSAEVADKNLRLLRPVVVIENWYNIDLAIGRPALASGHIKNYGGSIATDVVLFTRQGIHNTVLNGIPNYSGSYQRHCGFLAPNGANKFSLSSEHTEDDIQAVLKETKFWNVWGYISYKTPFGHGVTRFGLTYKPTTKELVLTEAEGFNTTEHTDDKDNKEKAK